MNFNSPDWKYVVDEIDKRVAALDKMNRAQNNEVSTSHLRGQIAALMSLRAWPETSASPEMKEILFQ